MISGILIFQCSLMNIEQLLKDIKRDLKKLSRKKGLDHYFLTLFFYSILLDADKMDASGTELPKRIVIF